MAASLASTLPPPMVTATLLRHPGSRTQSPAVASFLSTPKVMALKLVPKSTSHIPVIPKSRNSRSTRISCSVAQPETLQVVQSTIAKQLSIDEGTVKAETKFIDLGADSLDTVEIMMALEEKFGVSIGEGGAENISTVQDAADLIEKVKEAAN